MGLEEVDALADLLATECKSQQRNSNADGKRNTQDSDTGINFPGGTGDGDGGKDRSGTRHEHHAHRQTNRKTTLIAGFCLQFVRTWQELERPFQQLLQLWEDHSQADEYQQRDADLPQNIGGQTQRVQQRGGKKRDDGKAGDSATDDEPRPRFGALGYH